MGKHMFPRTGVHNIQQDLAHSVVHLEGHQAKSCYLRASPAG